MYVLAKPSVIKPSLSLFPFSFNRPNVGQPQPPLGAMGECTKCVACVIDLYSSRAPMPGKDPTRKIGRASCRERVFRAV